MCEQTGLDRGRGGGRKEISCLLILVNAAICCAGVRAEGQWTRTEVDTDTGRFDDLWWIAGHMEARASITCPRLYRQQMRNHN